MTERRRVRRGLLAVGAAVLLALAGCGVPDSGPPVVVSTAPVTGSQGGDESNQRPADLPTPETATNPSDLVQLFYRAAGADPNQVQSTVSAFFTSDVARTWRPDPAGLTVVRITSYTVTDQSKDKDGQERATVRARGQLVGVLGDRGIMQSPPLGRSRSYQQLFHLVRVPVPNGTTKEWLITNPPSETLMSTEAMSTEYNATILYFASPDHRSLVPDLRYMSVGVLAPKQRTILVDWLLAGPSPWLGQAAVNDIPDGTKRRGNVVASGTNVVVVDLSSDAAAAPHTDMLAAQLAWSLRMQAPRLQLRVEGRAVHIPGVRGTTFDASTWHGYNMSTIGAGSTGYYVSGGRIVPATSNESLPAVLSGSLAGELNSDVQRAALSVDGSTALLVRAASDGGSEVWLGRAGGENRGGVVYTPVTGLGAHGIGTPSLLPGSATALVPVRGSLRSVGSDGAAHAVTYSEPPPGGNVTAVSVAPDGCRVALVADGHLYVAPLLTGPGAGRLTIGRLRPLASTFTQLTEVTWTQEDEVAFGGRGTVSEDGPLSGGPRGGVWQFSVDDVSSDLLTGSAGDAVPDQLASATSDPSKGGAHGTILLAASGRIAQITGNEVGPPGGATRSPHGSSPFFPS
ncbi:LpqB family beta-propeller domain-containing protein [Actinocatenispora rupis]|uniref:GerMN domain-containing protein n=1 Tax=Actinocatenispora rupis TaxID=519421 RepID=A0A8J3NBG5_9ACTN|nr:LpqB family beta-propeller domain-containing protein [Actinocatenispora rupis]GID10642.1 hypothetical protein Aru02nite_15310 [Actinocatenispora rupis]